MSRALRSLIEKDFVSEWRSQRVWAETLYLGVVTAFLFSIQIQLPGDYQGEIGAPLLWFAILFAGMPTLEHSFATEREDGFLDSLLMAPVPLVTVYLAKLAVNVIVLGGLACLLIALWVVLLEVPLLDRPVALLPVAFLGSLGIASVGTLLSALLGSQRASTGNLMIVVLPLVLPVVIAASEATRLILEGDLGLEWLRWILFLLCFGVVFTVAGSALFEFAVKE